jgi:recombination associated protein RdgC
MWFRNLQLFKFSEPFTTSVEVLIEKLQEHRFMPCRAVDATSQGFVIPNGIPEGPLVYSANGFHLFCIAREDKIVPASVVKQMLDERIAEIEQAQGRKVRKREKETLKEDIYHQLVMRAFSKTSKTYAYIDTINGYLVVDAGAHSKAEEFSVMLRKALGSLKIEIPKVQSLTTLLTHWLKTNEYPPEFTVNDRCVITDPKEGGTIRCQRQNLFAEDIQTLIHEGRFVTELALSWSEVVSFNLKDDFSIKSLKFLEGVQDQAKDVFTETPAARFDADFTIMTESLRHFIQALMEAFGVPD